MEEGTFCPMIKEACKKTECMLWFAEDPEVKDGFCSLYIAAIYGRDNKKELQTLNQNLGLIMRNFKG
ncbi:MAG: hypothetical protein ABH950_03020 [Candidatus Altiarchaeota archaeon]